MMKNLTFLSLCLISTLLACTSPDRARATLEASGYKHIDLGGYSWSCSEDDDTCTSFTALSPGGRVVEGAVGCGRWTKGCTIRLRF